MRQAFLIYRFSLLTPIIASLAFSFSRVSWVNNLQGAALVLSQCHSLQPLVKASTRLSSCEDKDCLATADSVLNSLLPALPSYTNRVLQRSPEVGLGEKSSYMISAKGLTQPPFSLETELTEPETLSSLYLMTWERQYHRQTIFSVQRYHWLFLRQTPEGWEVVKLFSQSGPYPGYKLFPEPMDTTQGAMAEAIRLWLRDCQNHDEN